ncbi:hypothetical protein D3C80_2046450 [compost metagenome]
MISGRVPTTVTTFSFFISSSSRARSGFGAYWPSVGIRIFTVENFVGPKHDDHFVIADVGDVVGPAWDSLDNLRLFARGEQFVERP